MRVLSSFALSTSDIKIVSQIKGSVMMSAKRGVDARNQKMASSFNRTAKDKN